MTEGGHHIPTDTIVRRYHAGLKNFLILYNDKVDYWILFDNSDVKPELVAYKKALGALHIEDEEKWININKITNNDT